ncbi:MAG TPA: glutamate-1-semialdehyde 2,1-aminomutase [Acidimicrobiia bacterium]|nr:glutamate-1-semialdehyde 2,1-aminomutase [Acidimicrobiia bacterium]
MRGPVTREWFHRAKQVLPNGVSSGFRYWGDDDTFVIDRGRGGHVFDMDGNEYIDYQLGFGPVILGHGDPHVAEAVAHAATLGTTFAMTQRAEVEAAEKVLAALGWADRLRFTNTGTEATMGALRLARGWAARDLVLKFEGGYHGGHDALLFTTAGAPPEYLGSRLRPLKLPSSSGIPDSVKDHITTLPYNDVDLAREFFEDHGRELAAVIVEPMAANFMGVTPEPGFLEALRRLCDEYDSVLIFDEVKTGFRLGLGGAVAEYGVVPDIGTYAKAMGNGFPVAAIALNQRMVEGWELGGISQTGTYSGNRISVAAASATIDRLSDGTVYEQIRHVGTRLMTGLQDCLDAHGLQGSVVGHPSMFSIYIGEGRPVEYRDVAGHDSRVYDATIMRMIELGVMPCPDALETWFVCGAHTDDDVDTTLTAFDQALTEVLSSPIAAHGLREE